MPNLVDADAIRSLIVVDDRSIDDRYLFDPGRGEPIEDTPRAGGRLRFRGSTDGFEIELAIRRTHDPHLGALQTNL